MKNTIGFRDSSSDECEDAVITEAVPAVEREPVCCIAKVSFKDSGIALDYYNDEFYLEPGDRVFVSGKHYGSPGLVESVTTHFRIDKSKYKKVIAKSDLHITGSFIRVKDKYISFDTSYDAAKFETFAVPPRNTDKDGEEDIICGEGWCVPLSCFEESKCVSRDKIRLGFEYCAAGRVLYLSLANGKGTAFIKGREIYKAEFEFDGETVTGLFCSCPFNDDCMCKHEIAVLITLRMLMGRPELEGKRDFAAFDAALFRDFAASRAKEITLK
ncbi:MAG: hypothetical protein IKN56_00905 [Clostridia bacterium]|nr:hypothetical protein [Clostridia bacterium]MBR6361368.1 hypothetical protein [Clostridia bacterium]